MVSPEKNRALAPAHMLSVMRGAVLAVVLFAGAPSAAALFGVPQFAGSFAFGGIIVLVESFAHLSIKQAQRDYDYGREALAQLLSNLTGFVAVIPAVYVFADHRAILASFVVGSGVYAVSSHVLARTPYRLRSDWAMFRAALLFGVPLTLNGLGLAIIAQLDRAMVGHWFGVDVLATYAVILSISVLPVSLIHRVFGTMGLSFLISKKTEALVRAEYYSALVFVFAILATAYTLFIVLTLDVLTPIVFGPAFSVEPGVHVMIAAIVFLRLQMGGAPTNLLLATGRTRQLALLNLSSGFGLVCAIGFVQLWGGFESLLFGLLIGDIIRFPLFYLISSRATTLGGPPILLDLAIAILVSTVIAGMLAWSPEFMWTTRAIIFTVGAIAIGMQLAYGFHRHSALRGLLLK